MYGQPQANAQEFRVTSLENLKPFLLPPFGQLGAVEHTRTRV